MNTPLRPIICQVPLGWPAGTNCGRNAIKKIQLGVEKVDQHRGTDDPPERHGARLL
jgi:hypothetical protein